MFEHKTHVLLVAYERHDNGEEATEYEFLYKRGRSLTEENYERRLYSELAFALDEASVDDHDGVCVVAYERCDGATKFEDSSYAVVAFEQQPGRGVTVWSGDEVAEQIQLW